MFGGATSGSATVRHLAAADVRGHRDGREAAPRLAGKVGERTFEAREALGGPVLGAEGVLRVRALARRELREEVGHAPPVARPAVDFGFADSLQRVARARALINQGL